MDSEKYQLSRAQTRANYDRLSGFYDQLAGSSERACRLGALRQLAVRPGERILEIGPGTGQALVDLSGQVGADGLALGVDLSAGMLRVAGRRLGQVLTGGRVCLLQGDAMTLPLAAGSLDGIFAAFSLELFAEGELETVLAECRRALRPGGRLAAATLSTRAGGITARSMQALYAWAHRVFPAVVDCRPLDSQGLLEMAGFKVLDSAAFSIWGLPAAALLAVKA